VNRHSDTSVSLLSTTMAEGSASSSALEIEYFATIYDKSLDTFNSYMESLREHVNLLYGPEVVNRINSLGLHQDDCRLSGLLIQLALDERVARLSGCDFLRLCNVRLMDLLNNCYITHEGLASKFIDDQSVDLETCMLSLECVYMV
jgi:hypothetical protein